MSEFTVRKDGRKYTLVDPTGVDIVSFKTKGEAVGQADELNAAPHVSPNEAGTGWLLVADSDVVETFRSKRAAEAALKKLYGSDGESTPEPSAAVYDDTVDAIEFGTVEAVPPAGPVVTLEEIEAMDRAARLTHAMNEHHALTAWRESGGEGDRPSTPMLDFFADPNAVAKAKKAAKSNGERKPRNAIDPAVEESVVNVIVTARAAADSWTAIATALNASGVTGPTGEWTDAQVYAVAKRRQLAVFGPNRDEVK